MSINRGSLRSRALLDIRSPHHRTTYHNAIAQLRRVADYLGAPGAHPGTWQQHAGSTVQDRPDCAEGVLLVARVAPELDAVSERRIEHAAAAVALRPRERQIAGLPGLARPSSRAWDPVTRVGQRPVTQADDPCFDGRNVPTESTANLDRRKRPTRQRVLSG